MALLAPPRELIRQLAPSTHDASPRSEVLRLRDGLAGEQVAEIQELIRGRRGRALHGLQVAGEERERLLVLLALDQLEVLLGGQDEQATASEELHPLGKVLHVTEARRRPGMDESGGARRQKTGKRIRDGAPALPATTNGSIPASRVSCPSRDRGVLADGNGKNRD